MLFLMTNPDEKEVDALSAVLETSRGQGLLVGDSVADASHDAVDGDQS